MPLPPGVHSRKPVHTRSIEAVGWKREDGLWDIEASLADLKHHDYPLASGVRRQGDPVHHMRVRLTIDHEFGIRAAAVVSDAVPYPDGCEKIAADYERLVGLNLVHGFRKTVGEMFAGVRGCTHLTDLLQILPAVAIQTFASEMRDTEGLHSDTPPFQLDRCHALNATSETVRRYYPRWYRSNKTGEANQPSSFALKEDA